MKPNLGFFVFLALIASTVSAIAQTDLGGSVVMGFDDPSIQYASNVLRDPISALQRKLDRGEAKLRFDKERGYLPSVLELLNVPVSSQGLVFSKTSFQLQRITPQTPRAIYFNDQVYVGYVVDGDVVEASAVDPEKGAIFYTLDQTRRTTPRFVRRDECLQCHASPKTLGVPGHMVRSVYTATDGYPIFQAGGFVTDHRSPMKERWGGWYVTGTHGADLHMGNVFLRGDNPDNLDLKAGANVTDLASRFDTDRYLSPHSDIVALMALEHQTRMHNLITRVSYEARTAMEQQVSMNRALKRQDNEWSDSTRRRVYGPSEVLLQYMLFRDEAPLTAPVKGTSTFTGEFSKQGPRDRKGRSLRDLDLTKRLLRYPCSYLIYSEAYDALPKEVSEYLNRRLWEVLSGADAGKVYATLTAAERRDIAEILRDTKPAFAAYWDSKMPPRAR